MALGRRSFFRYFVGFTGVFIVLQAIIIIAIVNFSQHMLAEREQLNGNNLLGIYHSKYFSRVNRKSFGPDDLFLSSERHTVRSLTRAIRSWKKMNK